MTVMHCDCGFVWESEYPRDSVDYHMMAHAGERYLVSIVKDGDWFLNTAVVAQRYGFTRDN